MALRCVVKRLGILGVLGVLFPGLAGAPGWVNANGIDNLPSLGDAGGAALSVQDERRLGELIMKDYRAFGAVASDPQMNAYLNGLGRKIVQAAGENPANFEFFLVAEPSINAFALPGGYIGVHTGLIAAARTESELASVLAHEVAHVTQRHIARMYGQQKQTSLVSTAALIAAILVASNSPQTAQGLAAAGVGYQLDQRLSFSRDAEREADRVGLTTLARAGYEPRDMVTFFGRLQQSSRFYENNAPAYLRTHPLTAERIADIQNRVAGSSSDFQPEPAGLSFELVRMRALVATDQTTAQLRDRLEALTATGAMKQLGYTQSVALLYGRALLHDRLGEPDQSAKLIDQAIELERKTSSVVKNKGVPLLLASHQMELLIDRRAALNGGVDATAKPRTRAELNKKDEQLLARLTRFKAQYKGLFSVKALYATGLQAMGLFADSESYLRDMLVVYKSRPVIYDLLAKASLAQKKMPDYHLFLAKGYAARGAYRPGIEQTELAKRYAVGNYYLTAEIEAVQRELIAKADEERALVEAYQ